MTLAEMAAADGARGAAGAAGAAGLPGLDTGQAPAVGVNRIGTAGQGPDSPATGPAIGPEPSAGEAGAAEATPPGPDAAVTGPAGVGDGAPPPGPDADLDPDPDADPEFAWFVPPAAEGPADPWPVPPPSGLDPAALDDALAAIAQQVAALHGWPLDGLFG